MPPTVSLTKLLGACLYEAIILIALSMLATALFMALQGGIDADYKRAILQAWVWLFVGAYFVWCWRKSGQTLASQAWKIRLENQSGELLSWKQAAVRYILASLSLLVFGLGFLWVFFDKNHLFIHDRMLKFRFVNVLSSLDSKK